MHLFLRYDLSKRYCENFCVTLFYNWQSKLFIRFVSKKDLKKCSIRCVVLKCSSLITFLPLRFIINNIVSKWNEFFRDNYILTLVVFIPKHAMKKKLCCYSLFYSPCIMFVAVVLLTFLENVQKNMQYKDVIILLFLTVFKFVNESC